MDEVLPSSEHVVSFPAFSSALIVKGVFFPEYL